MSSSVIIGDPSLDPFDISPELAFRPKAAGIVQVQMNSPVDYKVFIYPDKMVEFTAFDAVRAFVRAQAYMEIKNDPGKGYPQADLEASTLAERVIMIASNFKLANLDLKNRTTVSVPMIKGPVSAYVKLEDGQRFKLS